MFVLLFGILKICIIVMALVLIIMLLAFGVAAISALLPFAEVVIAGWLIWKLCKYGKKKLEEKKTTETK